MRERDTKKQWERGVKKDGEKIGSAFGSRLDSHARLFLLFKAHREVIGGKDGKIPPHPFLQCQPHHSALVVHTLCS